VGVVHFGMQPPNSTASSKPPEIATVQSLSLGYFLRSTFTRSAVQQTSFLPVFSVNYSAVLMNPGDLIIDTLKIAQSKYSGLLA